MDMNAREDWRARGTMALPWRVMAAALLALPTLLAACSTQVSARQDQAIVREFAAKGYAPAEHYAVTTSAHTWTVSGQAIGFVLAQPARVGSTPVVVYLPGLGETSDSGERWRTAWASAGYAVVSVQLLADDSDAWKSELARAGEFKALGRQRYAGAVMSRRVQLLADFVAEGRRRSLVGEATWQRLDWNTMAVAGFDLGAFAAMTVAGEHVRGAEDATGRVAVRAAIALSPYASFAVGSFDTRYRDISAPVMSVTSDVDGDVLGLVEGAYLRDAPFTQMVGSDKFLLSLQGLPHARLSGSADAKGPRPADADSAPRAPGTAGPSSGGDSGQRRKGGSRGSAGDAGSPGRDRSTSGEGPGAAPLSPSALQMRMIAAQDITTAFLDAYLKDDPLAREWLAAGAARWLGTAGELHRK